MLCGKAGITILLFHQVKPPNDQKHTLHDMFKVLYTKQQNTVNYK